jgi:hypothetical protein
MIRSFSSLVALLGLVAITHGQALYQPRNIKQAYTNQTRDMSGKPGKNYWQNTARYDIQVTANPPSRTVYGTETINYINNSPDTLKSIVIRLICNLHKIQAPRSGYVSQDFLTDGVFIDTLLINNVAVPFNNNVGTVANVRLPKALNAKDSLKLNISWHYDMSVQSGREGAIDSTTFFLAYFYPRISVYDDYNGWDRIEHSDKVEFYSDFNDYRVAVKVPANYVVWGTGVLQNPDEVLQPAIAKRLKESHTSDNIIHIATKAEMAAHQVTRQQPWNTWHFHSTHIADATLGLSNHYVWDAASVTVDSAANRRTSIQAAYNDTAADFHHSVDFSHYALNWFSYQWPGVAYPFPTMTAFQGYADMEYPMMVNDETTGGDLTFAQLVQDHEIAHTYFPFYMGINESRYAYMDEGWATTFEYLIGIAERGQEAADDFFRKFRVNRYINDPSAEEDQPIITMSNQLSGAGYGNNAYGKPSLSYLALKDLLGDQLFKKALHTYMDNWNGKHPIPWDFFNSINAGSGQNLNWFFNNWFYTNNYLDLKLTSVKQSGKTVNLVIDNTGGFAIPFDVVLTYEDGTTATIHKTPAVWQSNGRKVSLSVPAAKKVAAVKLDGGIFMDATPADNEWKK